MNASSDSTNGEDPRTTIRRAVYGLLIALSVGHLVGRVLAVNSVDRIGVERLLAAQERRDWQRQRPFLSANDRSRWCTVRSLVEQGTYAIDDIVSEPNWDTIDMVKHDGRLYSSKPPLLATLVAAPYWVIHRVTGATLGTHPYAVGRTLLMIVNVVPWFVFLLLIAQMVERYGRTDWGRMFVMAGAAGGTLLTTFGIVLNNHLVAAVSVCFSVWAVARIAYDGERSPWWFAVAGGGAAMAAANELPALSFLCAVFGGLLWFSPRATLVGAVPAVLFVAAGFFGTNYIAHQSLRPPYMHRSEGDNWYDYTYERNGRVLDSYWRDPQGIDRGEPSRGIYAVNVLVGHHGVFSLTPMWILAVAGVALASLDRATPMRSVILVGGGLAVVCLAFYLARPLGDRNYGGMTAGFRWMFWFAPLWLASMLPAADRLSRGRAGRGIALVLLGCSALSVSYPTWNPWTQPWIWDFFASMGWVGG